jgi:hypothetical protein
MIQALIPALAPILSRVAGNLFPDPEAKAKAEAEMALALMASQKELEHAAAGIIKAEASSANRLASSWRPIVMLTFAGLIVARWFGWAAPNLSEAEYLKLWDIVELGLGGYVISRSVEKVVPHITDAVKNR